MFDAGKYISFEEQINLRKGNYYDALKQSSDGWHESKNDYSAFIMEFITTVYMCYKELDKRFAVVGSRKITKQDAVVAHMGELEMSNERNINKMIVNQVLPTCQLQMGMTELAPGSVWNTMPAHVHSRRMEAYFYFELPEDQAACHFMGEPQETRHIWLHNEQAVISPEWSIHSAAATHNYTFIWGMGGENLDYGDQDFSKITDLK